MSRNFLIKLNVSVAFSLSQGDNLKSIYKLLENSTLGSNFCRLTHILNVNFEIINEIPYIILLLQFTNIDKAQKGSKLIDAFTKKNYKWTKRDMKEEN